MEGDLKKLAASCQVISRAPKAKNTQVFIQLAEKIDEVLSNCQSEFISVSLTPVVKECIQSLIELLQTIPSSSLRLPSNVIHKTLTLLIHLVSSEPCLFYLMTQHHIISLLSTLLPNIKEGSVSQILKLVSALTASNHCVNIHVREIEHVLKVCNGHLLSGSTDVSVLSLSLEVLVNVCRVNIPARSWIRSQPIYDSLQKKLVMLLSNKSVAVILASIHLLAILSLKEKLGEKIFKASNLQQTVQLVLSVMSTSGELSVLRNATDLVKLLLSNRDPLFSHSLKGYSELRSYLAKILKRLNEVNTANSAQILEFLCVLCSHLDIAADYVISSLFTSPTPSTSSRRVIKEGVSSGGGVLGLMEETDLIFSPAVIRCFKLFHILIQSSKCVQLLVDTPSSLSKLLSAITITLTQCPLSYTEGNDEAIRIVMNRINGALSLLHSIVKSIPPSQALPKDWIDSAHFITLIDDQFRYNNILNGWNSDTPLHWSNTGLNVSASAVNLILLLQSNKEEPAIQKYLQDPKLLLMLTHVLRSSDSSLVNHGLHILKHLLTMDHTGFIQSFSDILVNTSTCDSLLMGGAFVTPATSTLQPSSEHSTHRFKDITNLTNEREQHKDSSVIDELMERFKSGFEIRDVRTSEIMKLYEEKLKTMTTKESHLQDLLEAKTAALSQADRLLSQYKGKMTSSDIEFEKMREIIQGTENECDRLRDQEIVYCRKQQEFESMINELQSENTQLSAIAEQHQILLQSYQEQSVKLELLERSVADLQKVKSELESVTAKLQYDVQNCQETISSRERDVSELNQALVQCQGCLGKAQEECKELNTVIQSKDRQILVMEETQENYRRKISELTNIISESEKRNNDLLHQLYSQLNLLRNETVDLQRFQKELKTEIVSLNSQITTLEETLEERTSTLTNALTESKNQNEKLLQKQKCLMNEKSSLQKTKGLLESEIKQLSSQISTLTKSQQELDRRVSELSNTLKESEHRNKGLTHQLLSLEETKTGLLRSVSQLESKVKVLEEEKDSLSKTVSLFSAVKDLISKGETS